MKHKGKNTLTKAVIKENRGKGEYVVEDIFDKQEIHIQLSGNQRVNYYHLEIGDEIYVECSSCDSKKGRLITGTNFKMDETNFLRKQKNELDKKQKKRN